MSYLRRYPHGRFGICRGAMAAGGTHLHREASRVRALSARRLDQPLKPPSRLRQACVSSALIPGAGLRGIRREAKDAKVPEHNRIESRAEQERSLWIAGACGASQHQTCRHDVAVLQIVLSALE